MANFGMVTSGQKRNHKKKANRKYWVKKIERNIERDLENTNYLLSNGWVVFRFWEHEIKKDLSGCVKKITVELRKAAR